MSQDRDLIDNIKANFARKSSAQLQEIMRADNPSAGPRKRLRRPAKSSRTAWPNAQGTSVAEEEPAPPAYSVWTPRHSCGALASLTGLLTGYLIIQYYRAGRLENPG